MEEPDRESLEYGVTYAFNSALIRAGVPRPLRWALTMPLVLVAFLIGLLLDIAGESRAARRTPSRQPKMPASRQSPPEPGFARREAHAGDFAATE
jgi:hypothetical protein